MPPKLIFKEFFSMQFGNLFRLKALILTVIGVLLLFHGKSQNQAKGFFETGKSLYEQKKYSQAREYFQKAVNNAPDKYGAKGNYHIALTYVKQKKCENAQEAFKSALLADPLTGGASSLEKFKEQLAKCNLTIETLNQNSANTEKSDNQYSAKEWFLKGKESYEQKNYSQAVQYFKLAYLSDSVAYGAKACYQIALCYKKQKDCSAAKPFLAKSLALDPEKAGASTKEKFLESLTYCHFSVTDLKNTQEPVFQIDSSYFSSLKVTDTGLDYTTLMEIGEKLFVDQKYDSAAAMFMRAVNLNYETPSRIRIYLKAAKAFVKAGNCQAAFEAYSAAYQLDREENKALICAQEEPERGQCDFTRADLLRGRKLTNFEKSQLQEPIIWSFFPFAAAAFIIAIIIFTIVKRKTKSKTENNFYIQRELPISAELEKKLILLPELDQKQVTELFRKSYFSLQNRWLRENNAEKRNMRLPNYFGEFDTLWEEYNQNPEQFITGEKYNELIIRLLLLCHDEHWYCYFTGQYLDEKVNVVQIKHPSGRKICVWASKSIVEKIKTKQPAKVRLHQVTQQGIPTWVHWSYDTTFFLHGDSSEKNITRMQEWKGEAKTVLPETIPDIIFKPSMFYNYPHPESIYNAQLSLEAQQSKTGYQNTTTKRPYEEPLSTIHPADVYVVPVSRHEITHRDNS